MNNLLEEMIQEIIGEVSSIGHIDSDSIPNIDLYMDQVTTFMEEHLSVTKRFDDDKILTKTMINNYAKNDLIPPPIKKKYSKEHILILLMIYYYKSVLSINDIEKVLIPVTDRFYQADSTSLKMGNVYDEIFAMCTQQTPVITARVNDLIRTATSSFSSADSEDIDYLQLFSYICLLSQDVYMKTMVIQKIIDTLPSPKSEPEIKKEPKKK